MKQQFDLKYRPDIDGLRALSVLTILVFHLNQTWIPGGFASVSLFFVISGFLITSIITNQLMGDRYSFKDFYTRRIKRILPLFFVVLFTVFIFTAVIVKPWDDYGAFWKTVRYAMQFRANQAFLEVDYFGPAVDQMPLLHLWTLALEEQFYFFWPITLFLLYKVFKKTQNPKFWLFWSTVVLIIASTSYSLYVSDIQNGNPYFLLRARAGEILVGCALALSPYSVPVKFRTPLGIFGIVLILLSYIFFTPEIAYPGYYGLIPSLGAAFFILDSNISHYKKIFTNKVIVTIGLWSFSIYLWHWPILALFRYVYMDSELPVTWMVTAYTLTLILSYFTYNYVENPLRKIKLNFKKSLLFIYIIPFCTMFLLNEVVKSDFYKDQFSLTKQRELTRWFNDEEAPCYGKITNNCTIGDLESDKKFLLLGDSHAAHLATALDVIGQKEHWKVDIIAAPGCVVFLSYDEQGDNFGPADCRIVNQYFKENWDQYDGIMLSQLYAAEYQKYSPDNHKQSVSSYYDELGKTLAEITESKPVYLFSDTPNFLNDPMKIEWFNDLGLDRIIDLQPLKFNAHSTAVNEKVIAVVDQYDNAYYVDTLQYVPEDYRIDGKIIYRDVNHFSPYGSRKIGERFIEGSVLDQSLVEPADQE